MDLLYCLLAAATAATVARGAVWRDRCLTGYMTDLQPWVGGAGALVNCTPYNALDLSRRRDAAAALHSMLVTSRGEEYHFRYFSMAKCALTEVPSVFNSRDAQGRPLSRTLQYVTFYGNVFSSGRRPHTKQAWSKGLKDVIFTNLLELDLRLCSIQYLDDYILDTMPTLKALYLSENSLISVTANAFFGLQNLRHLDLSRNIPCDENKAGEIFTSSDVFANLASLYSLDLSFTTLSQSFHKTLNGLTENFERLSLCYTGLYNLDAYAFNRTRLKILDVSGNHDILANSKALRGVEDTLEVLYADNVALESFSVVKFMSNLTIAKLSNNAIITITPTTTNTLKSMKILDLSYNKIDNWSEMRFSYMPLSILMLNSNRINLITAGMLKDIMSVSYISLSGNFFVCSCLMKEYFNIAIRNEERGRPKLIPDANPWLYHTAYKDYATLAASRKPLNATLDPDCETVMLDAEINGKYVILDADAEYRCLDVGKAQMFNFAAVKSCPSNRNIVYEDIISEGWNQIAVTIVVLVFALPLFTVMFVYRRNFRYFLLSVKNSATLSLMHSEADVEGGLYHYDVFVSYCHDDRGWVLDRLLPQVESGCNVSVCLHERDFQVGLSILENIVSCMDKSQSIILIISQRFLLSQWCQFEMHLAQHRLLETRREDLILILLEDIPRHKRPNTLQYLMLTKTYLLWPSNEVEQPIFWKRLKKCLVTRKLNVSAENVSLA